MRQRKYRSSEYSLDQLCVSVTHLLLNYFWKKSAIQDVIAISTLRISSLALPYIELDHFQVLRDEKKPDRVNLVLRQ